MGSTMQVSHRVVFSLSKEDVARALADFVNDNYSFQIAEEIGVGEILDEQNVGLDFIQSGLVANIDRVEVIVHRNREEDI